MLPPSSTSLKEAEGRLDAVLRPKDAKFHPFRHGQIPVKDASGYADDFFAITDALLSSRELLVFLSDQSLGVEAKKQTLRKLFGGKVADPVYAELQRLALSRWRAADDLATATESLGIRCLITAIATDRRTRKVEAELFQLATKMKFNPEASDFLSNPNFPTELRCQMLNKVLDGKADPATALIAQRATIHPIAGRFRATVNQVVLKIAAYRNLAVAKVTSPIELTDRQTKRLEALLSQKYGQPIEANVIVDPAVIGGLRIEFGDRVIDDTVRARLYDAERHFKQSKADAEFESASAAGQANRLVRWS